MGSGRIVPVFAAAILVTCTMGAPSSWALVGGPQADAACTPDSCSAYAPYPTSVSVSVPVTATIATDCGFDPSSLPSGDIHAGELNGAFNQQINFGLRCPTPLNVGVVSSHGGLQAGTATPVTGYTIRRDYNVELFLKGSSTTADADCLASNLVTAGSCTFRGPATSIAGSGGLELTGTAPVAQNGAGYVAGSFIRVHDTTYDGASGVLLSDPSYADTLTVTLSAVI